MAESSPHHENGNGAAESAGPKLGRVGVLEYRRDRRPTGPFRGIRSWARKNFSRKQLMTSLRTMLWVVPLTIMIWIYAEREQQYAPPPVIIPIEVASNDPNRVVTLRRDDPLVMAKITGPRSGVEAVMHSWDPNYGGGPVRIEIDRNLGVGDRRIDASVIGNDPRFANHGVSVLSCQPAWLDVVIDQLVEKPVEVRAINVPSNVASVTFSPPIVKVRGPERVLNEAMADGTLHVDASLKDIPALQNASPSDHTLVLPSITLALSLKGPHISIVGSPLVQANVTLASDKKLTIPTVTLEASATQKVLDDYKIDFEPTLNDVTVIGPEDKLTLLDPNNPDSFNYRKAVFEVTRQDIAGATGNRIVLPVEFKFPPGVKYDSGPKTVTITITDRGH